MRVLVTGATGMLGKDIVNLFSMIGGHEIYAVQKHSSDIFSRRQITSLNFDLSDPALLASHLKEIRPQLIIHCAGIINIDACEDDKETALKLHSETIKQIAVHTPASKLVYISTDSVFDGTKGNYDEDDKPNPLNHYAKTKLEGEQTSLKLMRSCMVIRTNIFGFHLSLNKTSLAEWAIENLENHKSIRGITDIYFNPVYTVQLADVILNLVNLKFCGLINVASGTFLSKYLFLNELAKQFGFDQDLIEKQTLSRAGFRTQRPANTTLNTQLLADTIGVVPDLFQGIKQFYNDYQNFKNNTKQAI